MTSLNVPLPPPPHDVRSADDVASYGRLCMTAGIFNERAAVLIELDKLAREFAAANRPNIARRVREVADAIDARLRDAPANAPFSGGR